MSTPIVLGIDLGTSSAKVSAVRIDGVEMARGVSTYPVLLCDEDTHAKNLTATWWNSVKQAVGQALCRTDQLTVEAIGLSGQMHGVVLLDASGIAVRPPIIWTDTRAAEYILSLARLAAPLRQSLLNKISPGFAAAILHFLARREPQSISAAHSMLQPKDWLGFHLTAQIVTDPSDASATGLWDFTRSAWHYEFSRMLSIRDDLLPPVRPSHEIRGYLREAAARDLGLPSGIPVVLGTADTPASHLGSGVTLDPGQVILNLGTGGQICQILGPQLPSPPPQGLLTLVGSYSDTYYLMAPIFAAGLAFDWIRKLFSMSWEQFYDAAFSSKSTSDAPMFFPFNSSFSNSADIESFAAFKLLRPEHTVDDIARAGLEGVGYTLRLARDEMREYEDITAFDSCTLVGGGSKDRRMRQLLADILGLTVRSTDIVNASARGAALTASVSAGWFDSLQQACRAFALESSANLPDPLAAKRHDQRFKRFSETFKNHFYD